MKINVALLEQDLNYQNRLVVAFREKFSEHIEIFQCNAHNVTGIIEEHDIKVLAMSQGYDVDLSAVPEQCGIVVLTDNKTDEFVGDYMALCKYQKVSDIGKQLYYIGTNYDKILAERKEKQRIEEEERKERERIAEEERLRKEEEERKERERLEKERLEREKKEEEERIAAEKARQEEERKRLLEEQKAREERIRARRSKKTAERSIFRISVFFMAAPLRMWGWWDAFADIAQRHRPSSRRPGLPDGPGDRRTGPEWAPGRQRS